MRIVKGTVKLNLNGCRNTFEFEVDDDATEEEIETMAKEAAFELVEWYYDVEPANPE